MRPNKLIFTLLTLLAVLGGLAACDAGRPAVGEGDPATGQQIYETHCAACHGIAGVGQVPEAPMQRDATGRYPAPPHNDKGHTWHHDDDLLFQIVSEGGMGDPANFYEMPAFGDKLTADDINNVLAYIKTLWTEEQRAQQRQLTADVRSQEWE